MAVRASAAQPSLQRIMDADSEVELLESDASSLLGSSETNESSGKSYFSVFVSTYTVVGKWEYSHWTGFHHIAKFSRWPAKAHINYICCL